MKKHIIWTNCEPTWLDELEQDLREDYGDDFHYGLVDDALEERFDDERINLNVSLSESILTVAVLGLWSGRKPAYRELPSKNIRDCLFFHGDYATFYLDKRGDLCCDDCHHDGTNHYTYRMWNPGISDARKENLKLKIYNGTATRRDITRATRSLGAEVAKVYGWTD